MLKKMWGINSAESNPRNIEVARLLKKNIMQNEIFQKAQKANFIGKLYHYTRLSGPGWVQAAVTLGGGTLVGALYLGCLLYTSPSPRDGLLSRMPSSA